MNPLIMTLMTPLLLAYENDNQVYHYGLAHVSPHSMFRPNGDPQSATEETQIVVQTYQDDVTRVGVLVVNEGGTSNDYTYHDGGWIRDCGSGDACICPDGETCVLWQVTLPGSAQARRYCPEIADGTDVDFIHYLGSDPFYTSAEDLPDPADCWLIPAPPTPPDAGYADTVVPDTATPDTAAPDTAVPDTLTPDTATAVDTATTVDAVAVADGATPPDAVTQPDAVTPPDAVAQSDAVTQADAVTQPDAVNQPDAVAQSDAVTQPDSAIRPDSAGQPDGLTRDNGTNPDTSLPDRHDSDLFGQDVGCVEHCVDDTTLHSCSTNGETVILTCPSGYLCRDARCSRVDAGGAACEEGCEDAFYRIVCGADDEPLLVPCSAGTSCQDGRCVRDEEPNATDEPTGCGCSSVAAAPALLAGLLLLGLARRKR